MNIIKLGFISLFLVSIFIIYFGVRPGEFEISVFLSSIAITLPVVIYLLVRSPQGSEIRSRGFYTNLSLPIAAIIFGLISFAAFSVDFDNLRLDRATAREEGLLIRIINLHLVLFFFLCVYRYSNKQAGKNRGLVLLLLGFTISMAIAYFEGRRTAAVIPILLVGMFSLTQGKFISNSLNKILFFSVTFLVVFSTITFIRSPDLTLEFIVDAVLSRIFNPGYIILEIVDQQDYQYSPDTISNSVQRFFYIFGLTGYEGNTNEFGRYYGFLSSSNFFVGINPGIIVESFLNFRWFYLFPIILLFEFTFIVLQMYKKLLFGSDMFVAILVLHGMQMEMPYLVGLLIKLALVAVLLRLTVVFFPSRSS